jgi:hypothetical protein
VEILRGYLKSTNLQILPFPRRRESSLNACTEFVALDSSLRGNDNNSGLFGWHLKQIARLIPLYLLLAAKLAFAGTEGDPIQLQEQEIKAGLIYNFLKYTEGTGPAAAQDIVVCLFDGDPFQEYLQPMKTRSVNQKKISLSILRAIHEGENCNILFVGNKDGKRWPEMQKFLEVRHILTVSDINGFSDSGGMIEFTHKDSHISVNLNMEALVKAGLRVQERMLRLVTVIHAEG